jgi:hypothetical protein
MPQITDDELVAATATGPPLVPGFAVQVFAQQELPTARGVPGVKVSPVAVGVLMLVVLISVPPTMTIQSPACHEMFVVVDWLLVSVDQDVSA